MKKVANSLGALLATFRAGLEKSAVEGGSMTPEELEELQAAQADPSAGAAPEPDPAVVPVGDGDMAADDIDPAAAAVAAPAVNSGSAIDAAVEDVAAAATQSAEAVAALKDIAKTASAKSGEAIIKSAEEFGRHFAKAIVAEFSSGSDTGEELSKEAGEQLNECFNHAYLSTMIKMAGELSYALTLDKLAADVAAEPEEETAPDDSVKGKGENASLESVPGYMENLKKSEGTDASLEEIPGSVDDLNKLTKNAYELTVEKFASLHTKSAE